MHTVAIMIQVKSLGDFILSEMDRRQMSARAFADFVGVNHRTINKFINSGTSDSGYPSVEFLIKLATATHTDICYLMALVAPDLVKATGASTDVMILSQRIEQLPENVKEAIDGIISKFSGE